MSEVPLAEKSMPLKVGGRFENPWPTWKGLPSSWQVLKWSCMTKERNTEKEFREQLPIQTPIWQPTPDSGIIVTWLGHASVLVQIDGFNVVTDPIFSPRCSPIPFAGPTRFRPPPCTVDDLPKVCHVTSLTLHCRINAVVISHNHYDHLDYCAVQNLHQRFGNDVRFYIPLGLRGWFAKAGITNVIELNWWQSSPLRFPDQNPERSLEIVCLPAQHWSLRSGFDRNSSLWSGWGLIGKNHRFFFAGDTGYCPEFKNIGAHYGPFDVCAIPIGCYLPRDFMCAQHVNPADAVMIHQDVRSKFSIGIHWGTYDMGALEAPLAPKVDLLAEVVKAGIGADRFFTINQGQSWTLPPEPANQ